MKRRLIPVCLMLAACGQSNMAPPPEKSADAPAFSNSPSRGSARAGNWARASAEHQGKPIVWEYREDFPTEKLQQMPQLMVVSLFYEPSREDALPNAGQEARFDLAEERMRELAKGKAELVAAMSWNRQHDWYFYGTAQASQAEFRKVFADAERVAGTVEDDATGKFYSTLLKRMTGK
ncbi:DUF695 domain-containing protein [Tahibacter amnicola]|uniref:DUF695 domain-containing protein n=1 Tax=Tahibacter amnicola TaxID=2976241 RepID=A0ABY6BF94_9GAMM|nr:DUF695 domain-containing protein [Tahibacter amnicola]UXI68703.1 DUF695 domain-containing protein [Tahibacter amnicola]